MRLSLKQQYPWSQILFFFVSSDQARTYNSKNTRRTRRFEIQRVTELPDKYHPQCTMETRERRQIWKKRREVGSWILCDKVLVGAPDSLRPLLVPASPADAHQSVSLRKAQNSRRHADWLTGCCTCGTHVSCARIRVLATFVSWALNVRNGRHAVSQLGAYIGVCIPWFYVICFVGFMYWFIVDERVAGVGALHEVADY